MEARLLDLLHRLSISSSQASHTHVTLYSPNAYWNIPPENQAEFWVAYCDLVSNYALEGNLCLAETTQKVIAQSASLTFRFHADSSDMEAWEPYDEEFLQWLCHVYQEVLLEKFKTTEESYMELIVVVLESQNHWFEQNLLTGQRFMVIEVKLQFPYARVDTLYQVGVIRPKVIQALRTLNILSKMQRQPTEDWEQIISSSTVTEPVTMYGSSSSTEKERLELKHIWPRITRGTLDKDQQPIELPLEDSFVPVNHNHVQQGTLDPNIFNNGRPMDYWLPLLLSTGHWPTMLLVQQGSTDTSFPIQQSKVERSFGSGSSKENKGEDITTIAEKMLQIINHEKFYNESSWYDIGRALHTCYEGSEGGLSSWIRNSEKKIGEIGDIPAFMITEGTIAHTCNSMYSTFTENRVTLKTLAWYARESNIARYSAWHDDSCRTSMKKALTLLHTDVAVALYKVYWLDFMYYPQSKKWFQFDGNKWKENSHGIELRKKISSSFANKFEEYRTSLSEEIHNSDDEFFKSNSEIAIKKVTILIGKLKTVPFKTNIMAEATEQFFNESFISLLDTNPNLTGTGNGVIEICSGVAIHRNAKPEDYISMSTGINYPDRYHDQHLKVIECKKWMRQVFTDEELLHHFLKFSASCLRGRNSDKIFPIWTGDGDNSKSMIVKLFERTFGSYCIKFPVAMLCEKAMNASGPTPQLARAKSTRIAFIDEPEEDTPMNKSAVKRYTGGDSFFTRLLHENGGDVEATFKMVLMCNTVPVIPNADKAVKNRTHLFPFMSNWVDDPPKSEEEQYRQKKFKKDPNFERLIPLLAPSFLWIITNYYKKYHDEGLVDPDVVIESTKFYWKNNDVYAQFVADAVQEMPSEAGIKDERFFVSLAEMYSEFKIWFRDAFPSTKVPQRGIFRGELSTRWGRVEKGGWYGIRLISSEPPLEKISSEHGNRSITSMTEALGGRGKIPGTISI